MGHRLRSVLAASFLLASLSMPLASASQEGPAPEAATPTPPAPQETENAPAAVVLLKRGTFTMLDPKTGRFSPSFTVEVKRKILTEEGRKYGEVQVFHSRQARLMDLEGRTVLPDGRELPLPKEAVFKRRLSRSGKQYVSSVVFPGVEVGAVLVYRYRIRAVSLFSLEPWYFQEEIPTVFSEVIYEIPSVVTVRSYIADPLKMGIEQNSTKTLEGGRIWASGRNLPALPEEPFAAPYEDLSSWYLLIPVGIKDKIKPKPLLETWATACDLLGDDYDKALRKSTNAGRKAQEVAGPATGAPRARAEALYRFVRDQIETGDLPGVSLRDDTTADSILAEHRGDSAGKALLLKAMLQAAGVPGRVVWASDRNDGRFDAAFPNPRWFDRVLVLLDLDGKRVFLDPSDRSLAFGRLAPGVEGMPALIYDRVAPELISLPETPYTESLRRAKVELDIDAEGRLSGRGSLKLSGHQAWSRLGWMPTPEETVKAWTDWLAESYVGFALAEVQVVESLDLQTVEVTWSMTQREEEVLGDEVSLSPSLPLGPATQPFRTAAASRISPILFDYADREEVELSLHWPEGWVPDVFPREVRHETAAGAVISSTSWADGERSLTFHRRLDVKQREFARSQYAMVQALFARAEKTDSEKLILVRK